jgi:hypothetical protein
VVMEQYWYLPSSLYGEYSRRCIFWSSWSQSSACWGIDVPDPSTSLRLALNIEHSTEVCDSLLITTSFTNSSQGFVYSLYYIFFLIEEFLL